MDIPIPKYTSLEWEIPKISFAKRKADGSLKYISDKSYPVKKRRLNGSAESSKLPSEESILPILPLEIIEQIFMWLPAKNFARIVPLMPKCIRNRPEISKVIDDMNYCKEVAMPLFLIPSNVWAILSKLRLEFPSMWAQLVDPTMWAQLVEYTSTVEYELNINHRVKTIPVNEVIVCVDVDDITKSFILSPEEGWELVFCEQTKKVTGALTHCDHNIMQYLKTGTVSWCGFICSCEPSRRWIAILLPKTQMAVLGTSLFEHYFPVENTENEILWRYNREMVSREVKCSCPLGNCKCK